MAEFGAQDAQEQIHTLVERNTSMMARAEKDAYGRFPGRYQRLLCCLPMITGVLKMIVDLGPCDVEHPADLESVISNKQGGCTMKEFLEEYGGMVIICIVGMAIVTALINSLNTITAL
ncbi:MAG: hypothetical protein ACLTX3_07625 [Lachnospiraceae bacterium]